MKRFIFFILFLIFAVWLGIKIKANPGYMLLSYGHWSVEMPLWLGIVSAIILFFIIYWILRFVAYSCAIPGRYRFWSGRRRSRAAHQQTNRGLIALAEGNWSKAERNLLRAASYTDTPLINYLATARAAQAQGAYDRRDNYLRKAHQVNPDAEIAVGLTQAQLQLDHKQLEQALATLTHLKELVPHHRYVLKLLQEIYLKLHDWKGFLILLPELRKYKVLSQDELVECEKIAYQNLLQSSSIEEAHRIWEQLPKAFKTDPILVEIYAQHLIQHNESSKAETLLCDALRKHWDESLLTLYGSIKSPDAHKQLAFAEGCLKQHKHDALLMFILGKLSANNQLWGKARSYFESSIEAKPSIEAYRELAKLLEKLGEHKQAMEYYKKAVEKA